MAEINATGMKGSVVDVDEVGGVNEVQGLAVVEGAEASSDRAFTVIIASTGCELEVGVDEAILDVLEENGVAISSRCREGICGTCETPMLSGTIVHRDFLLTDEEKQAGDRLLVCVSRASSPELVLDL